MKNKITVDIDDIKPSVTRRSCFSLISLIKFIFNFIVCVAIMLIVGAFTRSSTVSVATAFIYCGFYPKVFFDIAQSLIKNGTIKEVLFSQNHLWNALASFFFFSLYLLATGLMQLFIDERIENHKNKAI